MASAPFTPLQPTGVGTTNGASLTFLSSLAGAGTSVLDRSFSPDLVEIFGNQNYTMLLELLGKKEATENQTFYHYEERGKLHAAVQVSATVAGTAGTTTGTLTTVLGSNYSTYTPLRNGEIVENATTGVVSRVGNVTRGLAQATFTLTPLLSTANPGVTANDWLLFKGLGEVGESSTKFDNINNMVTKVSNTTTEIREDFEITDRAMMEKIEFAVDGVRYYRRKGTKDAERRFLNNIEDKLIFGIAPTNTTVTANGTAGTSGLVSQVTSRGGRIEYTKSSALAFSNFQEMTRQLDFNGAAAEAHVLSDVYQFQKIQADLFTLYPQGAILWDSVGGNQDAAAKMGFRSLAIDGYQFHFKKYAPFSPEWKYGVAVSTGYAYNHYGLVIPQGMARDPKTGSPNPIISTVTQSIPGVGDVNAYEWGGLAPQNKDGQMHVVNTMITYKGLRVRGANQCVIFKGV